MGLPTPAHPGLPGAAAQLAMETPGGMPLPTINGESETLLDWEELALLDSLVKVLLVAPPANRVCIGSNRLMAST